VAEPVCEQPPAGPRAGVMMAATEVRDGRRVPWMLSWTRQRPTGWQLAAAGPVLQ
jgi:phosphoenolpyruvate carboxylase